MDRQPGHLPTDVRDIVNKIVWVKGGTKYVIAYTPLNNFVLVIALGNAGVGKTCLIKHFCESKFSQCYHATVGVDYGFKVQTIKNTPLRIHLWDLSGDPQYYDVRTELYHGTDACFLVYDVTNPTSFEKLGYWIKELSKHGALGAKVVIVGNKADLRSNKESIAASEGRKWATSHKLPYYETSALSGDGVNKMFEDLLTTIADKKPKPH